jgi:hypothetical protein
MELNNLDSEGYQKRSCRCNPAADDYTFLPRTPSGAPALYAIFGKKNARVVDYWCKDTYFTKIKRQGHF